MNVTASQRDFCVTVTAQRDRDIEQLRDVREQKDVPQTSLQDERGLGR